MARRAAPKEVVIQELQANSSGTLEEIVAKDPTSPLYLPYAERLRERGFVEEALRLCEERRTRPGRSVGDRIVLGRTYLAAGRLAEAGGEFRAALDLDRENIVALKALAGIEAHEGRHAQAADLYRAVCRIDPGDLEAQTAIHQLTSTDYADVRPPEMVVSQGGLTWEPVPLPREEEHLAELALGLRTIREFGSEFGEQLADRPRPTPEAQAMTEIALEDLAPIEEPAWSEATRMFEPALPAGGLAEPPAATPDPVPAPAPARNPGPIVESNRTAFQDWLEQMGEGR